MALYLERKIQLHGLRGKLDVTLEEATWAAWLYDVLKPHVHEVVV